MKHLTDDQLSALQDDALAAPERAACDAHLEGCEACRVRVAESSTLDESLGRALTHDPGDAYFADFAERVAARIASAPEAPGHGEPAPRLTSTRSPRNWFLTPRGLSFAGSTAALLVIAGLAWTRFQRHDDVASALRADAPTPFGSTLSEQESPAPAEDREKPQAQPPLGGSADGQATEQAMPAPASGGGSNTRAERALPITRARAREVRPLEGSEQAPVPAKAMAPEPTSALAPTPAGEAKSEARLDERESAAKLQPSPITEMKRRAVAPATGDALSRTAPPPAMLALDAHQELASACGTVHDTRGIPVAGAQVVATGAGTRTSRSGPDGRFCLTSLHAGDTLSVLRVGFEPMRFVVGANTSLAVRLEPVGTLGPQAGMLLGKRDASPSLAPREGLGELRSERATMNFAPDADHYLTQSAAVRSAVVEAREAVVIARRERTAGSYEKAFERWDRIGDLASGKASFDARFQALAALREAHRLEPTPARAARLRAGLTAFIAATPRTLPERATALRWQQELAGPAGR